MYVQYGCGLEAPEGWLNFDGSPRLYLERFPLIGPAISLSGKALFPRNVQYGNIVEGLPVKDGTINGLYCSHVLEHIDRVGVEKALRNSLKLLKPGCIFRLVVPDLLWRAQKLMEEISSGDRQAADRFMRGTYLGEERRERGAVARLRSIVGNSDHRWMYDYGQMQLLLEQAGFVSIRRCELGDCEDQAFTAVEQHSRFFEGTNPEVAIEARRPTSP